MRHEKFCVWVFVNLWCTKKNKNKKKNSSKKKGLWIFRVSVFLSFFCVFVPSLPFYYHINIAHRCISLAWIYQDKKKCVSFKKLFLFFLCCFLCLFFENIVHIIRTWLTKKGVLYDNSVELYTSSDERSPMDILRKLIKFTTSLLMTEQQFREKNHFTVNYYPYHATNVFWWIS